MNLLTAEHLTKVFTERKILDNVDFSVDEGEKIGVIGVNGTGKSTLLKILSGLEYPDEGNVVKGRNLTISYLPQDPIFADNSTVMEAITKVNINSLNEWSIEAEAESMINRLGLPGADEKIAELSGGQKKRISLANVLLSPADLLILDEPTNHLDSEMAAWLENFLTDFRGSIIMVTHDRYFLDSICTRIVEIDHGRIYNYPGNYAEYLLLKAGRQNMEIAAERKRQSLLRTELAWLSRGARARTTKQKAHIERIRSLQKMQAPEAEQRVTLGSTGSRMGRTTIGLKGICKSYGGKNLIRDFSYIFLKHDRIGITGRNGCGKTTLLKIICGLTEPDEGFVDIGQTIHIGYFAQDNEIPDQTETAIEYVKEAGEYIRTPEGSISASSMLERFLFDLSMQKTRIEKLSGGEKRRLYLMHVLMSDPNVLILDEPTNNLDIQTLEVLEDYLDSFDGIVITVSHDRYFLDRIVQRIFAFEEGGNIRQYEGNYSDYLNARPDKTGLENDAVQNGSSKDKISRQPQADISYGNGSGVSKKEGNKGAGGGRSGIRKLRFTFSEQKEYEVIDDEIAALEEKISTLGEEMARYATDYEKLDEIVREKNEAEERLEEKTERWVYLCDLKEKIDAQNR